MLLFWRLGMGSYMRNKYLGWIMVIKHQGRKSGQVHLTPVNYAAFQGDIYCTAGFGRVSDWYKNIIVQPHIEIWLPHERWSGFADDISEHPNRVHLLRQVLIASGFAAPMFGVYPLRMSDEDIDLLFGSYRLIRIKRTNALTGKGGPGDLTWVWPLTTLFLLWALLENKKKK